MEKSNALLIIEYRVAEYLREYKRNDDLVKNAKPGSFDPRARRKLDDTEIAMMDALKEYVFHPLGLECGYTFDHGDSFPTFTVGPIQTAVPEIVQSAEV